VGGLINVITTDPASADKLSINSNISSYLEGNVDLGFTKKMGKVNMLLGVNYFKYGNPVDLNDDNFTDVTLQDRISVFNKWNLERPNNRIANVAFRYVYEDRWGGEMQWTPEFRGGDIVYGESIWTNRYEIISNYQLPLKEKIIFQTSASRHEQNSVYGDLSYVAEQVIAFNQLNWHKRWGKNNITAGLAHRYTFYDDNTTATNSISDTVVINNPYKVGQPGIFLQDLILFSDKSQMLLGMRLDLHPQHGRVLSPRVNYKISPTEKLDFRFALGNGFRVVNLFAEEHAALTGARAIVIKETLKPETCYNASINVTKKFFTSKGLFTLDGNFFYTYFTNKINPDYNQNDNEIVYENLDGYAIYRGVNLDARFKFEFPLTINAGITFLDAFQMNRSADGSLAKEVPLLTEGLSGSLSVSYLLPMINMYVDYTATGYGSMDLPVLAYDFRDDRSKPYAIHNLKLTKTINEKLDIYVGVKNIFNFKPPSYSIMRSFDPFDQEVDDPVNNPYGYTFDPAYVYAPNQGVRGYFGIKFKMK
jgi:outer membrane receptor for ferrienterochelin and colicins